MSFGALIEKFRAVALERLERMNALLVNLERSPDDPEAVEEILREIHTLKGEAKMMGFADVNLVAHQTEHLLLDEPTGAHITQPERVELIFEGLDLMRALMTKSAGNTTQRLDLSGFVDRVNDLRDGAPAKVNPHDPAAQQAASPPEKGNETPTQGHISPAENAPTAGTQPLDSKEESTRSNTSAPARAPAADTALATPPAPSTPPVASAPQPTRARIGAGNERELESGALRIQTTTNLRVDVEKLERLGELAGEALLMSRRVGYRLGELHGIRQDLRAMLSLLEGQLPKSHTMALRNLNHRLDACETALREESYQVNVRASQIDDQTRYMRHVPLAQVLSHYPRAVRDLAQSQGKRVRLVDTFGNVEVDRAILSALSEPLLHLVRNAVDHGLETPEERQAAGKEPEAEIELSAEYVGDSIRVVLSDDGRGIDPQIIRQKAIERGMHTAESAARLSDQEAIALIFENGFSTRDSVNDVSGRGIGMDVVRRQISRVGGFIEIESEVGRGTTFTLHLPVTTAVNSVLVFTLGKRQFALTAKDVERVIDVGRDDLRRVHGAVCVPVGERLIPLLDWTSPLGLAERGQPPERFSVLLIRKGARRVAVWIDRVLGEREAISRPLGDFLAGVRLCRGVALTDSGDVVPLLNVVDLMERSEHDSRFDLDKPHRQRSFTAVQGTRALDIRTILVVEDSEVTRTLVTSILRAEGYRVLEADDGHYGLEMLGRHRVDLVLTDIQMPTMDGLQLLQRIRASDDHARLPVVILTTLGEPADKERAMRLGANGYLVKLDFQEKTLLETVRRFL
ncbi:hybrid sensor histidine kinase/response regulator [Bradymonadaceae bacterium TMQ3]|nr:hybrid sensor histidine kinase/response regulator [Bradymonadaceae bacterium TMQ3]TXC75540.1 hybrid sensor histidine kinase/response regulator [Bradymonadales bacterium TMQ1]